MLSWYYLQGRVDHLIVVNGLNVYPYEILQMAYKNEAVQHAEVKTFINEQGFRRIKLILFRKQRQTIDVNEFKEWWLECYGTKFLPAVIEFKEGDGRIKLM